MHMIVSRFPYYRRTLLLLVLSGLCWSIAADADPVCVMTERANLRKGPGGEFPLALTVGQFTPFLKLSQKGGWSEVLDLDNEIYWVSNSVLSTRINCVVVKSKVATLRQAASASSPTAELAFADRYTPFKKVERDGAWIKLQDEYKATSWVHESNVWIPMMRAKVSF